MPSLSSSNGIGIKVTTEADTGGIDETTSKLGGMVDGFQDGMKKVAVVTGVAAAGLTAFSKSSTDYLVGLTKDTKALATQTGMTTEQSSGLLAITERMGISAGTTSAAFRTFSKQITDAANGTSDHALATQQLNNKIDAAKIEISDLTEKINKNGDASGDLHNKVQALNLGHNRVSAQAGDYF
jgi:hypothetical protein